MMFLLVGCATSAPVDVAASQANSTASQQYRIGPGDQLQVFVFNQPELTTSVPVRPDGRISTPLVEDMQATGKTPNELGRDMELDLYFLSANTCKSLRVISPSSGWVKTETSVNASEAWGSRTLFHDDQT
jgi:hypothetical protein